MMNGMTTEKITAIFNRQKAFFAAQNTQPIEFRKTQLLKLKQAILEHTDEIITALDLDLGKSKDEVMLAEINNVIHEIDFHLEHLDEWAKDQVVPNFEHYPQTTQSLIRRESFGVTYIISPFNYPLMLTFSPLMGAMIGGNTAIIKPSENIPHSSKIIKKIVESAFDDSYIAVIEGAIEENQALLALPFDFIFFTGSPAVGKIVMRAAAEHLTPVVLELGGKSPCIILNDADLDQVVDSICFSKFINSGQTCVAPDYLYVHAAIQDQLVNKLIERIQSNYSELGQIGKIITQKQVENLNRYVTANAEKVVFGGQYDVEKRLFQPTVMNDVVWSDSIMQQEIFGPVFPILTFNDLAEVASNVNTYHPKPLSAYVFTKDYALGHELLNSIPAGDAQINGTIIHAFSPYLPFGGIGGSGMGNYHGKHSYETFTHQKSILVHQ